MTVRFNTVDVDGLKVFYRSAGDPSAPAVLLLHGFPSASHMFRDLIPELAGDYHVVAPDLPGFGMTEQPARDAFAYTFETIAQVLGRFTEVLGLDSVRHLRLRLRRPGRLPPGAAASRADHRDRLPERQHLSRRRVRGLRADPGLLERAEPGQPRRAARLPGPQTTLFQYTHGVSDPALVSPDGRNLDDFYLARPGNDEIQLDLLGDYKTNVALYGDIQAYLREQQPPVLAIWGKNDPFFIPPGAEAFKRDVPDAEVRFVDSGHFALETHAREIGAAMRDFLASTRLTSAGAVP